MEWRWARKEAWDVHTREESRMLHQNLLCLLAMEAEHEERQEQKVFYRAVQETMDWIWRRGGRGKDMQLTYLLLLLDWPLGSQREPVGVKDLEKAMTWGRELEGENLCDLLGIGLHGVQLQGGYSVLLQSWGSNWVIGLGKAEDKVKL